MWYEATILEVSFPQSVMAIQYLDGKIEEEVPFEDIREKQIASAIQPSILQTSTPPRKVKSQPRRNPISLKTYMKILSSLDEAIALSLFCSLLISVDFSSLSFVTLTWR
jgi:hypothetical protein